VRMLGVSVTSSSVVRDASHVDGASYKACCDRSQDRVLRLPNC
jgi:hypothetical protein